MGKVNKDVLPKVLVVTHYFKDDKKFYRDYTSIEIFINEVLTVEYGDDYHDKGYERSKGFLDCMKHIYPKVVIKETNIADYDD